ncbi:hypothetical protein AM232_26160 [Bacillus sp. FJAT-21352]|nr:hypothetical protein AM232_26160 [Bacillus sp. FJAT-21352]
MDFLQKMFTDPSVFGSIIGGLIGGIFTYLAVILTFRNQNKNEYPQKLVTLQELLSAVETSQETLDTYFKNVEQTDENKIFVVRKLDTKELERSFMIKAVTIDRRTYKYVSQGSVYKYPELIRLSKSPEDIKHADRFKKYLHVLHLGIDSRIRYYLKKIE